MTNNSTVCNHPTTNILDMSKEADTTIPPIQSAYLNILTAVSDTDDAKDAWGRDRWDDAIMHIELSIEQLQSAKYKIQHHKQK